jgi:GNAT superfamily N-acetyltransferase
MSSQASIRHALVTDASGVSKLIASERMVILLAIFDQRIAGVLAIEDKSSIKYFFVDPEHQKMGIGKLLWQFAKNSGEFGARLKVRSSLFAVPVYKRLGFEAVGPPSCFNGLHYQSMANHNPLSI